MKKSKKQDSLLQYVGREKADRQSEINSCFENVFPYSKEVDGHNPLFIKEVAAMRNKSDDKILFGSDLRISDVRKSNHSFK